MKYGTKIIVFTLTLIFVFISLRYFFTIELLQQNKDIMTEFYNTNQTLTISIYMISYVVLSTLGLPLPFLLTLFSGYLFGTWPGLCWSTIAFGLHCWINMIVVRYLCRDFVQNKFKQSLTSINKGLEENGIYYLIFLRATIITPTFWINCACGLTFISVKKYILASVIPTLPMLYIMASSGKLLANINSYLELYTIENIIIFFSALLMSIIIIIINKYLLKKTQESLA